VLVSISAPILLRARQFGDLAVAVASLRTIHSAQNAFASACGAGMYASRLPQLLEAPAGGAPFISPDLGASDTVRKAGYTITMAERAPREPCSAPRSRSTGRREAKPRLGVRRWATRAGGGGPESSTTRARRRRTARLLPDCPPGPVPPQFAAAGRAGGLTALSGTCHNASRSGGGEARRAG
jgi:hypothetical protein